MTTETGPTERVGYFTGRFAVIHEPSAAAPGAPPVVLAAPLGDEMAPSRRALAEIARRLAVAGRRVLRFDYRGTGDSAGAFQEVTVARAAEDLAAAAARARGGEASGPVDLVGVRFGASLCLLGAAALGARRVCAVSPIVNGRKELRATFLKKKVREAVTEQERTGGDDAKGASGAGDAAHLPRGAVDIDGLVYGETLLGELDALDLIAADLDGPFRTLLLQVGPRKKATPEMNALAERLGGARLEVLYRPAFWTRIDYQPADDVAGPLTTFLTGEH